MQKILAEIQRNFIPSSNEARRLFHGRGNCYSGFNHLCIDFYPPLIHILLYEEVDSSWLADLKESLVKCLGRHAQTILAQCRYQRHPEIKIVHGVLPENIVAVENGLLFDLDFGLGRNIGFFPDMRLGRMLVRQLSRQRSVLNLFSYTCAFSVAALAGGAESVVNIDMNGPALERGRRNHRINGIDDRRASFLCHDIFRSFSKLIRLGPYDLIIVDPPTYQGKSFKVAKDYPRIVKRLSQLINPGGDIVACLNAPHLGSRFLDELFFAELPQAQLQQKTSQPDDFPECDKDERRLAIHHYRIS